MVVFELRQIFLHHRDILGIGGEFQIFPLQDPRDVIADPNARYAGAKLSERTLVPGNNARLGETRFETWLTQPAAKIRSSHPQPTGVEVMTKEKESRKKAS